MKFIRECSFIELFVNLSKIRNFPLSRKFFLKLSASVLEFSSKQSKHLESLTLPNHHWTLPHSTALYTNFIHPVQQPVSYINLEIFVQVELSPSSAEFPWQNAKRWSEMHGKRSGKECNLVAQRDSGVEKCQSDLKIIFPFMWKCSWHEFRERRKNRIRRSLQWTFDDLMRIRRLGRERWAHKDIKLISRDL